MEYRFFVLTNFQAPYPLKENGLIRFRSDRSRMKPFKSLIASPNIDPAGSILLGLPHADFLLLNLTYTWNEDPQPQVLFTFGFSNLKPAPSSVST